MPVVIEHDYYAPRRHTHNRRRYYGQPSLIYEREYRSGYSSVPPMRIRPSSQPPVIIRQQPPVVERIDYGGRIIGEDDDIVQVRERDRSVGSYSDVGVPPPMSMPPPPPPPQVIPQGQAPVVVEVNNGGRRSSLDRTYERERRYLVDGSRIGRPKVYRQRSHSVDRYAAAAIAGAAVGAAAEKARQENIDDVRIIDGRRYRYDGPSGDAVVVPAPLAAPSVVSSRNHHGREAAAAVGGALVGYEAGKKVNRSRSSSRDSRSSYISGSEVRSGSASSFERHKRQEAEDKEKKDKRKKYALGAAAVAAGLGYYAYERKKKKDAEKEAESRSRRQSRSRSSSRSSSGSSVGPHRGPRRSVTVVSPGRDSSRGRHLAEGVALGAGAAAIAGGRAIHRRRRGSGSSYSSRSSSSSRSPFRRSRRTTTVTTDAPMKRKKSIPERLAKGAAGLAAVALGAKALKDRNDRNKSRSPPLKGILRKSRSVSDIPPSERLRSISSSSVSSFSSVDSRSRHRRDRSSRKGKLAAAALGAGAAGLAARELHNRGVEKRDYEHERELDAVEAAQREAAYRAGPSPPMMAGDAPPVAPEPPIVGIQPGISAPPIVDPRIRPANTFPRARAGSLSSLSSDTSDSYSSYSSAGNHNRRVPRRDARVRRIRSRSYSRSPSPRRRDPPKHRGLEAAGIAGAALPLVNAAFNKFRNKSTDRDNDRHGRGRDKGSHGRRRSSLSGVRYRDDRRRSRSRSSSRSRNSRPARRPGNLRRASSYDDVRNKKKGKNDWMSQGMRMLSGLGGPAQGPAARHRGRSFSQLAAEHAAYKLGNHVSDRRYSSGGRGGGSGGGGIPVELIGQALAAVGSGLAANQRRRY